MILCLPDIDGAANSVRRFMETFITDDGLLLAYQVEGNTDAPALVFSNGLGTNLQAWDQQAQALAPFFRIVRYDTRGHGQSQSPAKPATIERLGQDLLGLLDHLGLEQAHICGLSLGGLTAQWLAAHHPQRLRKAICANTAARIGSFESWSARISSVEQDGMAAVREVVLARLFTPAFRSQNPQIAETYGAMLEGLNPVGYQAACAALRDADLRAIVGSIPVACLIIVGSDDQATPLAQAEALHQSIHGSRLVVLDRAAHLSNVEQPTAFTNAVLEFLQTA